MLDVLKALILDFQEGAGAPAETSVPRRVRIAPVRGKAAVCIGVRRCGKSTLLMQMVAGLLAKGMLKENVLFLNFFDDRLHGLSPSTLGLVTEAYYALYPRKKGAERIHVFFDEIQAVPGWEPFVDRLLRTERCEVTLTGSSARMLSKEVATQMRGRALSWELFPFSFREFLDSKGLDVSPAGALSTKKRLLVQAAFDEYWETGGFPEVLALPRGLRIRTHQEYFHTVLHRDLVDRHDVPHPRAVTDLSHRLVNNVGSLTSVNSLAGYLKSLGHRIPKSSVGDYLEWLEDAYFLFTVRVFDASQARRNTNPKKVYCVDHAMVRSVSSGILVNSGHLLENLVFAGLRRLHPEVSYFKTRSGREVDFVVPRPGREGPLLVQVSESLRDPATRGRELQALAEAMAETGTRTSTLVTRSEQESVGLDEGAVEVVPAWRFLLGLPDSAGLDA